MAKPLEVTDSTFATEVEQSSTPVLVDFWAPWCGPCLNLAPTVEQIAESEAARLKVVKLNVDENSETATRYQVMSIPTLILFKNGQQAERLVRTNSKSAIMGQLEKHL
jgi:thioredoxin 1